MSKALSPTKRKNGKSDPNDEELDMEMYEEYVAISSRYPFEEWNLIPENQNLEIANGSGYDGQFQLDSLGTMSQKCAHCGSKFFEDEAQFCCNNGAIKVVDPFVNFPECIKDRFENPRNIRFILSSNSKFAFACFEGMPIRKFGSYKSQPENWKCVAEVKHVAVSPDCYTDRHWFGPEIKAFLNENNPISKEYLTSKTEDTDLHLLTYPEEPILDMNSPYLDPMLYPLFFPMGTPGWHPEMAMSQVHYYRYLAMQRESYNPLHHGRCLSRQFLMDVWARIDQNHLDSYRDSQHPMYLSREHPGSYRNLAEERMDSLAIFSKLDNPHFFITFTANPMWTEIQENLGDCKDAHDRPDLLARVFKLKADRMLHYLLDQELFGKVQAYAMCYEWQKRGMPHIHLLLTMEEIAEGVVCDRMPDKEDTALYKTVEEFMVDDEKHVASYNPDLLRLFDAHINVKKCEGNRKFLIDYLHKGSAKEANKVWKRGIKHHGFNEHQHYLENRCFCAPEACHRLFGFPVFQRSHEVSSLPIGFPPNEPLELTEYFKENSELPHKLLYQNFPSRFTWDGVHWQKKPTPDNSIIGRLEPVSPTNKELFAFRCLLMDTRQATSFESLLKIPKSSEDSATHETFFAAASALNLFTNKTLKQALEECKFLMGYEEMRQAFVEILMTYDLYQQGFWDNFKRDLVGGVEEMRYKEVYDEIKGIMEREGKPVRFYF